eukprot:SAG31_NODE_15554_length_749_cov_1.056923_2_plen_80_part_00
MIVLNLDPTSIPDTKFSTSKAPSILSLVHIITHLDISEVHVHVLVYSPPKFSIHRQVAESCGLELLHVTDYFKKQGGRL